MAIVVIKENPVPRQKVTCEGCGSILEYGNADLQPATIYSNGYTTNYKIKCPVCGVYVKCDWIKSKELLNKIKIDFVNMYDWKFDPTTGGIFTGRHDMFGVEIYEGSRVKTPLGIGIVRYNPKYWRFEIAEENEPLNNVRENAGKPEECWVVL